MLVTSVVLVILASAIVPLAAVNRKREKEFELRSALREIRIGLDMYHEVCLASAGAQGGTGAPGGQVSQAIIKIEDDPGRECWPKELEMLVEGVETNKPRYKMKFLRRIPKDPFNTSDDEHDAFGWMLRSTTDNPESNVGWNKHNVFDVSSASESQALDGSYYKDW